MWYIINALHIFMPQGVFVQLHPIVNNNPVNE